MTTFSRSFTARSRSFEEAFELLDSDRSNRVTLSMIVSFCAALPKPQPSRTQIEEIYRRFDEDGSGDIDIDEFFGICHALEDITKLSTDKMSELFARVHYRKLFLLASGGDESSGGSGDMANAEIDRNELKVFLDMCSSVISCPAADLPKVFKDVAGGGQSPISFEDFEAIMRRLIKGRSIVAVTDTFSSANRHRLEQNKLAKRRFEKGGGAGGDKRVRVIEEDQIAAIAKAAQSAAVPDDTTHFTEAFTLMDSRGGGVLNRDAIYEFCAAMPNPPPHSHVLKLYSIFDEDGSDSIDPQEFIGFCMALEKLTNLNTRKMCEHFRLATYRRLFDLINEGGGDAHTMDKDQLRQFLEAISPLLSRAGFSTDDVYALMRRHENESGGIDFGAFTELVGVLLRGKSISQVLQVYESSVRERKAKRHEARLAFEQQNQRAGLSLPNTVHSEMTSGASIRMCFQCMAKANQVKELKKTNELLAAELAQVKQQLEKAKEDTAAANALAAASSTYFPPPPNGGGLDSPDDTAAVVDVRSVLEADTLFGNPFENLRQLHTIDSAPHYAQFPQLAKPAVFATRSSRLMAVLEAVAEMRVGGRVDVTIACRRINDAVPGIAQTIAQLRAGLSPLIDDGARVLAMLEDLQQVLVTANVNKDHVSELQEKVDLIQSYRMHMGTVAGDLEWLLDAVAEETCEVTTSAIAAAPYMSKSTEMTTVASSVEQCLQQLLDATTVLMLFGSSRLTDGEVQAKRLIARAVDSTDSDLITSFLDTVNQCKSTLSRPAMEQHLNNLEEALKVLAKVASLATSNKRDKSCATLPVDDIFSPSSGGRGGKWGGKDDSSRLRPDGSGGGGPDEPTTIANRSSSPRQRQKTVRPKDVVAHVDKLLTQYTQVVPTPDNFRRVTPNGNTFLFGTKQIELTAVDKSIVVKVGGGYLLFEEFCDKYCAIEMRRAECQYRRNLRGDPSMMLGGGPPGGTYNSYVTTPSSSSLLIGGGSGGIGRGGILQSASSSTFDQQHPHHEDPLDDAVDDQSPYSRSVSPAAANEANRHNIRGGSGTGRLGRSDRPMHQTRVLIRSSKGVMLK